MSDDIPQAVARCFAPPPVVGRPQAHKAVRDSADSGRSASLSDMGQEPGKWMRRPYGRATTEILCEGDGNFLIRSAMNRDRQLRLTADEMRQLLVMLINPGTNIEAPEVVVSR